MADSRLPRVMPDDPDEALDALCEEMAALRLDYLAQVTVPFALVVSDGMEPWRKQVWAAVAAKVDKRVIEMMKKAAK